MIHRFKIKEELRRVNRNTLILYHFIYETLTIEYYSLTLFSYIWERQRR